MLNETQLKKLDGDIDQHNKAIEEAVVSITEARSRQKSALAVEEFLGVFCNYRADGIPIFSHESNLMNGAEKSYLKAIRLICEKSILKKQITADDKRQRLFVLDNFLFDRLVEKHWA